MPSESGHSRRKPQRTCARHEQRSYAPETRICEVMLARLHGGRPCLQSGSMMRATSRILRFAPLLWLPACTATWNRIVQYSPEPAHYSVVAEVYRTVLAPQTEEPRPDTVAVQQFGAPAQLDPPTCASGSRVPRHWADTLKHEVRVALSDPNCSRLADSTDIVSAARSLGLGLLPADTAEWPSSPKRAPPPRVTLSRPGFNGDSTIAAIRMDVSWGPLCCSGETLLLARRPGKRWRVWYSFLHWVS